jgi:hypothetical protein
MVIYYLHKVVKLYANICLFILFEMKTILVINDDSLEAEHAAKFALLMSQKTGADILLANCQSGTRKIIEKAVAGHMQKHTGAEKGEHHLQNNLTILNQLSFGFKPAIKEVDISDVSQSSLATLIYKNEVWMVIKGTGNAGSSISQNRDLDIDMMLRTINCPLLLIPYSWSKKSIERLTYIADLRYCRLEIVKFIAGLAKSWDADMSIAHVGANGLPVMDEAYAQKVFTDEICSNINYTRVFFNHIKERNLATVVDVITNVMHNDILVLVNHNAHFEKIVGQKLTGVLPGHITIPLLIFP